MSSLIESKLPSEMKTSTGSCTTPHSDSTPHSAINSHVKGPPLAKSSVGSPHPIRGCNFAARGRAGQGCAGGRQEACVHLQLPLYITSTSSLAGLQQLRPTTLTLPRMFLWNLRSLRFIFTGRNVSSCSWLQLPWLCLDIFPQPQVHAFVCLFVPQPSSHQPSQTSKGIQGAPALYLRCFPPLEPNPPLDPGPSSSREPGYNP